MYTTMSIFQREGVQRSSGEEPAPVPSQHVGQSGENYYRQNVTVMDEEGKKRVIACCQCLTCIIHSYYSFAHTLYTRVTGTV